MQARKSLECITLQASRGIWRSQCFLNRASSRLRKHNSLHRHEIQYNLYLNWVSEHISKYPHTIVITRSLNHTNFVAHLHLLWVSILCILHCCPPPLEVCAIVHHIRPKDVIYVYGLDRDVVWFHKCYEATWAYTGQSIFFLLTHSSFHCWAYWGPLTSQSWPIVTQHWQLTLYHYIALTADLFVSHDPCSIYTCHLTWLYL